MGGYHNTLFPDDISYDSSGGPGLNTSIVKMPSGQEQRIERWSRPLWQFNVAFGIRTPAQLKVVRDFFLARRGAANSFPYKDWSDRSSAPDDRSSPSPTDQLLGIGDGVTTAFRLRKKYQSGDQTFWRTITKPVEGSVLAAVNTTPVLVTVDHLTGWANFSPAPAVGLPVTGGFEFYVPVRFGEDVDKLFSTTIRDFGVDSTENIELVEDADPAQSDEAVSYGGAAEHVISADTSLPVLLGRMRVVEATVAGLSVLLPDHTTLPHGVPYFYLACEGANSFEVKTSAGASLSPALVLTPGTSAIIALSIDSAGNKIWYA